MITSIKSNRHTLEALKFRQSLQEQGKWVKLHAYDNVVEITWGDIWPNGEKEKTISTRTYYMFNDKVEFITVGHI